MSLDRRDIEILLKRRAEIALDLAYWRIEWDRIVAADAEALGITLILPSFEHEVRTAIAAISPADPTPKASADPDPSAAPTLRAS